ncbi:MAG: zinc ribbon domain-containing protein [Gammaproteobacteria bacterium]|nr:zinc ribbon domain-containing protein [Gammaproteobacteria bacterium]
MPYYEYRCAECSKISTIFAHIEQKPTSIPCEHGCSTRATPIVSKMNVKLSSLSKVERQDPKYDKMVDQAMNRDPKSDPMRYVNRRGDPAKGKPD